MMGLSEEEADAPAEDNKDLPTWLSQLSALNTKDQPGRGIVVRFNCNLGATRDERAKNVPREQWHKFPSFFPVEQTEKQVVKLAKIIDSGAIVKETDLD